MASTVYETDNYLSSLLKLPNMQALSSSLVEQIDSDDCPQSTDNFLDHNPISYPKRFSKLQYFHQTSNVQRLRGANFVENAQRNSIYLIQKVS